MSRQMSLSLILHIPHDLHLTSIPKIHPRASTHLTNRTTFVPITLQRIHTLVEGPSLANHMHDMFDMVSANEK